MIYLIAEEQNYLVDKSDNTALKEKIVLSDLSFFENYWKDKEIVQIDTETIGDFNSYGSHVFTYQAGDFENQFVLDVRDEKIRKAAIDLNKSNKIKLLQNAKYDIKWFLRDDWDNINPTNIYDTFLAEKLIYLGYEWNLYPMNLDAIAQRHLGISVSKEIRGKINYLGLVPEVVNYAATDVKYLEQIRDSQISILKDKDELNVLKLENEVVRVFAEMEYNGIFLNSQEWLNVEAIHKKEINKYEIELQKYILSNKVKKYFNVIYDLFEGETLKTNFNSPTQILDIIKKLGKEKNDKDLINLESASETIIDKFAYKEPFIDIYLNYKEQQTLVSKYGKAFLKENINRNTNKIHCDFNQMVDTGRVACRKPNLQQIPATKEYRSCFKPTEGYSFISLDYSSQELVLIAEDSKDPAWIKATQMGWDLHSVAAELVFKDKWKNTAESDCLYYKEKQKCNCKEHKKLRDKIKTINYALSYGAGYNKIAANLKISPEEAKSIITEYFRTFKALKLNFDTLFELGIQHLRIRTFKPFRRIRNFSKYEDDKQRHSIGRACMNTRYQGTGADMMKLALVKLYKEFKPKYGNDIRFILQVHDQVVLEAKDGIAQEVYDRAKVIMNEASKVILKILDVKVDGEITKSWIK